MSLRPRATLAALALLTACQKDSDPTVDDTGDTSLTDPTASDPTDDVPTGGGEPEPFTVGLAYNRDVDLLFVIDDSESMAGPQQRLVEAFPALQGVLEAPGVQANYRIGFTTTNASNPRCPNTTPENGNLVLSSCLDRIADGQFESQGFDYSAACTANCNLRDSDLGVKGTATDVDPTETPRKWIELLSGESNVQGGTIAEAFACYAPQGVSGCGFESHLESMYKALASAKTKNNPNNYGFLRDQAILSVVIVSDEADCSWNPQYSDIFTTNKVFWYDPEQDNAPTSSMCWKAGVACSGSSPVYSECHSQNHDDAGQQTDDSARAVLYPVQKYIDFVTNLEQSKQDYDPEQQVLVSLLAGVPANYEAFGSEILYADSPDLGPGGYQSQFGIGPGCIVGPVDSPTATAVPPVREREFAEAFNEDDDARNLYSICDSDYSPAMFAIGDRIRDRLKPLCLPVCAHDTDPGTPGVVEANCQMYEEDLVNGTREPMVKCTAGTVDGQPGWVVPEGSAVCFAELGDQGGGATPSTLDDLSPGCSNEGFNLEFVIVRSGAVPKGTTLSVSCEASANKKADCPNL